jgi:hypothetical protein
MPCARFPPPKRQCQVLEKWVEFSLVVRGGSQTLGLNWGISPARPGVVPRKTHGTLPRRAPVIGPLREWSSQPGKRRGKGPVPVTEPTFALLTVAELGTRHTPFPITGAEQRASPHMHASALNLGFKQAAQHPGGLLMFPGRSESRLVPQRWRFPPTAASRRTQNRSVCTAQSLERRSWTVTLQRRRGDRGCVWVCSAASFHCPTERRRHRLGGAL